MRVHTVFRCTGGVGAKPRPPFFSKQIAFSSFTRFADDLPEGDRIFVLDGDVETELTDRMKGELIRLPGVGNARSYRTCASLVDLRHWSDGDLVYFGEDDYLYTSDAAEALVEAATHVSDAAYFTLYDHPDYYRLPLHDQFVRKHRDAVQVGDVTWRHVRSTTMTYAARVGAVRRDLWLHHLASKARIPQDFSMWSIMQGARGFGLAGLLGPLQRLENRDFVLRNIRAAFASRPRHRLYAAAPGKATHLEVDMLGPGQDWEAIAASLT